MSVDVDTIITRILGGRPDVDVLAILDKIESGVPDGISQRWRNQRDFYRSTTERFESADWRVEIMGGDKRTLSGKVGVPNVWGLGKRFILTNHYAGSYPQMRVMVGMFRNSDDQLVGVATFSNADADQARTYGGVQRDEIVELSRFVLLDEVPGNAETWFLARAGKLARELHAMRGHELKVILSFSDPVPRRSVAGFLTMPGHIGNIYQAHNAVFVGRSRSKTLYLTASGVSPDPRMLAKIKALDNREEQGGREGARRFVDQYGAPPRQRGEGYTAWVKRGLRSAAFRAVPHSGNLVYLWSLGGKRLQRQIQARFPTALAYPKTPRQRYINLSRKYERAWSQGQLDQVAVFSAELLAAWLPLSIADRKNLDDPPQLAATCKAGAGSPNRQSYTLDDLFSTAICS